MTSEKRTSYILITYNRADSLSKAIANIREFIRPDDELIIIDGGSQDGTVEIIKNNIDIVTYWISEKDSGPSHAINKGILMAKGRFVVNLNDDDYYHSEGITKAIDIMQQNNIDALLCGGVWLKEDLNSIRSVIGYQFLPEGEVLCSDIRNCLINVTTGFFILRKEIISKVGLFDTTVQTNDTDYSSRLILNKVNFKFLNVKMFTHISRINSSENINSDRARIDKINIAIKHGAWDFVLSDSYSFENVIEALKLRDYFTASQVQNLNLLKNAFLYFPALKKTFLFIVHGHISLLCFLIRFVKKFRPVNTRQVTGTVIIKEPVWDSQLR